MQIQKAISVTFHSDAIRFPAFVTSRRQMNAIRDLLQSRSVHISTLQDNVFIISFIGC